MSENIDRTPGTDPQVGTPGTGAGDASGQGGSPLPSTPSQEEIWQKRYSDLQSHSARTENSLRAELRSLGEKVEALEPKPAADSLSVEDFSSSVVLGETEKVHGFLKRYGQSIKDELKTEASHEQEVQWERQAALASVAPMAQELAKTPALANKVLQRYAELEADPVRT